MPRALPKEAMPEFLGANAYPDRSDDGDDEKKGRSPKKQPGHGTVARTQITGGDTQGPSPEALRAANRETLRNTIQETVSTVGISTLAFELARALDRYVADDQNPTLAGAQKLLSDIKGECDWGKAHVQEAIMSHFPENPARECICETMRSLNKRFGKRFSTEGARDAMDGLERWVDAIKADLRHDAVKEIE